MIKRAKQYLFLGGILFLFQTDAVQSVIKSDKLLPAIGIMVVCLLSYALYLTLKIRKEGQDE